ncbi:hypothetical protein PG995_013909 [Apiospora arundinis]
MSGMNLACDPAHLAPALGPHDDADYAYIESDGDLVNVTAMVACCAPQPVQPQDSGDGSTSCYAWCQLPPEADISVPESRVSWEREFQSCLNYEGRAASDRSGRFIAPKVRTVRKGESSEATSSVSSRHAEVVAVKRILFLALGVLSWAVA